MELSSLSLSLLFNILTFNVVVAQGGGMQVGEEVSYFNQSPHPYDSSTVSAVVWRDTIVYTDSACSYIALHFANVELDVDDKLIVRNLDSTRNLTFTHDMIAVDSFWGPPIMGNTIVIEIIAENSQGAYGYDIDKLARGFTSEEMAIRMGDSDGICEGDNKKHATCFIHSDPLSYKYAGATCRIWTTALTPGTGWLWGGDRHLLSAMHNFNTGSGNASSDDHELFTYFERRVESLDCETDCTGSCMGEIFAMGFREKAYESYDSKSLDYTLLKIGILPSIDEESLVYLKVREGGPKLHERVYIPGYPGLRGKMISYYSDHPADISISESLENDLGYVHLQSIDANNCVQGPIGFEVNCGINYYGDTERGMSGAPVIGFKDNLVVGLHTNGPCPNGGNNMWTVVNDIPVDSLPPGAIGVDCFLPWADITISEDEVISTEFYSTGNIYINNGHQLHVTGKLYMPENSHIYVNRNARLAIYNGGEITVCPYTRDKWNGIRVSGNNSMEQPNFNGNPYLPTLVNPDNAGEVYINGGAITSAKIAISTKDLNNDPEFYGGVLYINQGFFTYNDLSIEMMPYGILNKSRIRNSIFQNPVNGTADNAVWMQGVDGIEFSNCRFLYFNHEAIRLFDGTMKVLDDNAFEHCEKGISIESTMPNPFSIPSIIGTLNLNPNTFKNNDHHVFMQGAPNIRVIRNIFEGGISGVNILGSSRYDITDNTFEDMDWGTFHLLNGHNQNVISNISCNDFQVNLYGSVTVGNNQQTRYWGNQFDLVGSGSRDLMVSTFSIPGWAYYQGSIRNPQGDIQFPTDNCFTDPGQKIDILTQGSTAHFNYFHRPSSETTCGYEPLNPGNYTTHDVPSSLPSHDCYQFVEGTTIPENHSLTELDSLRQLLNALHPFTSSSIDTLVWYNQVWDEKEALLHHLVMAALDTNDIASAEQIISDENSVAADWAIYGLRLSRGDISGAASWLALMSDTSDVEQDFYDIQVINLAYRYDTTGTFALDSIQLSFLEDMAYGGSPVRDYARSLLGLLEGHRFYPEIPDTAELRYLEDIPLINKQSDWKIYPVPASYELQLEWKVVKSDATWQIRLLDMLGRQILTENVRAISGRHVINLNEFQNGFYFIVISNQDCELLYQAPIIILR